EDDERRVAEEDEAAAGAEQARGLRDPAVRVDPDRRAVLGDDEVGRGVGQARLAGVALDEGELDTRLGAAASRRLELRRRDVDADRPRPGAREPGGDVRRAAAELDDVEPGDIAENAELCLRRLPYPPRRLRVPRRERLAVGVLGIRLRPGVAI